MNTRQTKYSRNTFQKTQYTDLKETAHPVSVPGKFHGRGRLEIVLKRCI